MKTFQISNILRELKSSYGTDFLERITMQLHNAVQADYTFIARLDVCHSISRTITLVSEGTFSPNFEYSLANTPCHDVSDDKICVFTSGVSALYPDDELLVEMQVEGYVGAPLYRANGEVFGLVVALFKEEIQLPDEVSLLFELFAGRIAAEVERSDKEAALADQASRYQEVLSSIRDGFWLVDTAGKILEVNQKYLEMTGYSEAQLLDMHVWQIDKFDAQDVVLSKIDTIKETGGAIFESEHITSAGQSLPVEVMISFSPLNGGRFFTFMRDISERKRVQTKIQQLAYYDELTSLPNRQLLYDRLQQAMFKSRRNETMVAVLFLDLDKFKDVNDNYGHEVGDHLLVALASRIQSSLREKDTLARLGGDEFVCILSDLADIQEGVHIAQRMIREVQKTFVIGHYEIAITLSIGLSFYPQDGGDTAELIRHADEAMYRAKQRGRNRYCLYNP